jgi:hypothetical protein
VAASVSHAANCSNCLAAKAKKLAWRRTEFVGFRELQKLNRLWISRNLQGVPANSIVNVGSIRCVRLRCEFRAALIAGWAMRMNARPVAASGKPCSTLRQTKSAKESQICDSLALVVHVNQLLLTNMPDWILWEHFLQFKRLIGYRPVELTGFVRGSNLRGLGARPAVHCFSIYTPGGKN